MAVLSDAVRPAKPGGHRQVLPYGRDPVTVYGSPMRCPSFCPVRCSSGSDRYSDGLGRAYEIPMKKQRNELVNLTPGTEQGSPETPSDHRRLKTSLWRHFWGRRLL